jgi:hypothetical protein
MFLALIYRALQTCWHLSSAFKFLVKETVQRDFLPLIFSGMGSSQVPYTVAF